MPRIGSIPVTRALGLGFILGALSGFAVVGGASAESEWIKVASDARQAQPTPAATAAATVNVTIQQLDSLEYRPNVVNINVGDTVTWTNNGQVSHTVTSTSNVWDSGRLRRGESFSYKFSTEGSFDYHCTIHPSMRGTVNVGAAAAQMTAPSASRADARTDREWVRSRDYYYDYMGRDFGPGYSGSTGYSSGYYYSPRTGYYYSGYGYGAYAYPYYGYGYGGSYGYPYSGYGYSYPSYGYGYGYGYPSYGYGYGYGYPSYGYGYGYGYPYYSSYYGYPYYGYGYAYPSYGYGSSYYYGYPYYYGYGYSNPYYYGSYGYPYYSGYGSYYSGYPYYSAYPYYYYGYGSYYSPSASYGYYPYYGYGSGYGSGYPYYGYGYPYYGYGYGYGYPYYGY